jgi:L-alanine-DL-glutamate epimerase-like enolase superfamily enzyme
MRITEIRTDHYSIPLPEPLSDSTHGLMTEFALISVRIRCDDGATGMGYTYAVGNTGGSAIHTLIERDLAPALLDADPRRIEQLWEKMWWRVHWVGRGGLAIHAISAIDIALWDLKARVAGEPLWRCLGGHSQSVPAYTGGIDLDFPLDALLRQTEASLAHGFRAIKMKVGRPSLDEDVARVRAMRELVGPDVTLMADANMRWTADRAIQSTRAFQPFGLHWLEEPIIPDDVEGHVRVLREGGLPVATGENMHTLYEFQRIMGLGGVSFPEPDVANVGGITVWLKVAHLAQAHNLQVTSHGVHDLHVHLLAAVPNASYLEVHGFGLERFIKEPMRFEEGVALAPDRPGHGVALDWDALEAHRAG